MGHTSLAHAAQPVRPRRRLRLVPGRRGARGPPSMARSSWRTPCSSAVTTSRCRAWYGDHFATPVETLAARAQLRRSALVRPRRAGADAGFGWPATGRGSDRLRLDELVGLAQLQRLPHHPAGDLRYFAQSRGDAEGGVERPRRHARTIKNCALPDLEPHRTELADYDSFAGGTNVFFDQAGMFGSRAGQRRGTRGHARLELAAAGRAGCSSAPGRYDCRPATPREEPTTVASARGSRAGRLPGARGPAELLRHGYDRESW